MGWIRRVVIALLFANLALSAEHLFAVLWGSMALVIFLAWGLARRDAARRQRRSLFPTHALLDWGAILGISLLLSLVQGGFITETMRNLLAEMQGVTAAAGASNAYGFGLRWPPAVYSAHLGVLSLFQPGQLITLLFEIGPAFLLAPLVTVYSWRAFRRGAWLPAGLGVSAALSFLFPVFFQYGVDRSITRMTGTAMWLWLILCIPFLIWQVSVTWQSKVKAAHHFGKILIGLGYFVSVFGAGIIFAIQLTTLPAPQTSYFLDGLDSTFARQYWNRLEPGALVLDSIPERGVSVFGRSTHAHVSIYAPLPDWEALIANPDPMEVARAGYRYIYLDERWWVGISEATRAGLQGACVKPVGQPVSIQNHSRWLLDDSGCIP